MYIILYNIASIIFETMKFSTNKSTKCYIKSTFIILYPILSMSAHDNNKI